MIGLFTEMMYRLPMPAYCLRRSLPYRFLTEPYSPKLLP